MDGIIFDVDGTLWDAREEMAYSWTEAVRTEVGLDCTITAERITSELGKPMHILVANLFPEADEDQLEIIYKNMCLYENRRLVDHPGILYDGMKEAVKKLSETYKLFIVSNCHPGYIDVFLDTTGLREYFVDYTCPGDTGKLKGENIRIIMERNDLQDAIYVGDTQGDADACKEAGIPMIFAAYGYGDVEGEYPTIQSMHELPELIFSMENEK